MTLTPQMAPSRAQQRAQRAIDRPDVRAVISDLVIECGGDPDSRDGQLVEDLVATSLKLITDGRHTGELKLLVHSLKEMRHAMRVFAEYPHAPRVSIFGSARTPEQHPDYRAAVEVAGILGRRGWVSITGAGDGIMKAGHEGSGRGSAFGLAIRLPFEQSANTVIDGDPKLVNFKYFFARKTMFLHHSAAVVALPGGFGTLDELMETLTLVQTGKSPLIPIVLLAGDDGTYWRHWERYVRDELLPRRFISPHDTDLYHVAQSPTEAAHHILNFYRSYHSSRYIADDLVLRVRDELTAEHMDELNSDFADIVKTGAIRQGPADPLENEWLGLNRIRFTHTRRDQGRVRAMIDRINTMAASQ